MTRGLPSNVTTGFAESHVNEVVLVSLAFDTPVYLHSGIGTITYDGNDYLGVGAFGRIDNVEESEQITPSKFQLVLSGVDGTLIGEALTAGRYGDVVTVYEGVRSDDGTLSGDPGVVARGTFENATLQLGSSNTIAVNVEHDLSRTEEKIGARYTDEDQQTRFSGDTGFSRVHAVIDQKLLWGGREVNNDNSNFETEDRYY